MARLGMVVMQYCCPISGQDSRGLWTSIKAMSTATAWCGSGVVLMIWLAKMDVGSGRAQRPRIPRNKPFRADLGRSQCYFSKWVLFWWPAKLTTARYKASTVYKFKYLWLIVWGKIEELRPNRPEKRTLDRAQFISAGSAPRHTQIPLMRPLNRNGCPNSWFRQPLKVTLVKLDIFRGLMIKSWSVPYHDPL
jgi:hypothetical protein